MIKFADFANLTRGKLLSLANDLVITELITDSRKAIIHPGAVFFAIAGVHHDGHDYIEKLFEQGVRQFVVEKEVDVKAFTGANFLLVKSAIAALQQLAAQHRRKFSMPVIAITGSNGKTIVKEWLNQLLSKEYDIVKSPASYNSQIGVALSLLQIREHHRLGIFEAGISRAGEMKRLENMIQPTIGIFTNVGSAHDENFKSLQEKANEKMKLFSNCEVLVYCKDHDLVHELVEKSGVKRLSWGFLTHADVAILQKDEKYRIRFNSSDFELVLPFSDKASIENAFHCIATMLHLGYPPKVIQERVQNLKAVPMRLELKEGINQSQVIDDTYNNDLGGLRISLDFLSNQVQKKDRSLILSDIQQSGLSEKEMVKGIAELVGKHNLSAFVGIGKCLVTHQGLFDIPSTFYESTDDFLERHDINAFRDQVVLVKGARTFHFERIVAALQRKVHGTVMEVDLGALVFNLNVFRAKISARTKLMVMVKAFAYGSGNVEVANVLQYHKVDYLGVAYADEGVELRENNIQLPIMVMNPSEESFPLMMSYNLEPEIYGFKLMNEFIRFLDGRTAKIHIKIDSGMHRLGFDPEEAGALAEVLKANPNMMVESVFSHLAGSDEETHDEYSRRQVEQFKASADKLEKALGYHPTLHVLNTPGILRFPQYQMDMVRLGIGLYGIDPTMEQTPLKQVATLKTVVSQVRTVPQNETVGYGRRGIAERPIKVATIAIGYADGFSRAFSGGVGVVLVNGKRAPILGNVCMDMSMVDVTDLDVKEGDEVVIFGKGLALHEVADRINTIPYEILTNTSDRVKRVFVAEGL